MLHAVYDKTTWLQERGIDTVWPVAGLPETVHVDNGADFRSFDHGSFHRARQRPDEPSAAAGRRLQAIQVPATGQGRGTGEARGLLPSTRGALAIANKDRDRLILARKLMKRVTVQRAWAAVLVYRTGG
jgi:hypothetical protein